MFIRTKKRAFSLQIPSVRRLRSNVKRTNQFLDNRRDNPIEEEFENDNFFNLKDDASILNNSNDTLLQIKDDSDNDDNNDSDNNNSDNNDSDNNDSDNDDSDNNDDGLSENDIFTLNSSNDDIDDHVTLLQTESDDNDSLPQTIEDEQNARFEPIQGEYGPYFNNFTEQMLFFWTTKHIISR
jgi:hypothetical protein